MKTAVLGAGTIGASWAGRFAAALTAAEHERSEGDVSEE
jgi:3-hydroxyacyl-CoA dehydrogenase